MDPENEGEPQNAPTDLPMQPTLEIVRTSRGSASDVASPPRTSSTALPSTLPQLTHSPSPPQRRSSRAIQSTPLRQGSLQPKQTLLEVRHDGGNGRARAHSSPEKSDAENQPYPLAPSSSGGEIRASHAPPQPPRPFQLPRTMTKTAPQPAPQPESQPIPQQEQQTELQPEPLPLSPPQPQYVRAPRTNTFMTSDFINSAIAAASAAANSASTAIKRAPTSTGNLRNDTETKPAMSSVANAIPVASVVTTMAPVDTQVFVQDTGQIPQLKTSQQNISQKEQLPIDPNAYLVPQIQPPTQRSGSVSAPQTQPPAQRAGSVSVPQTEQQTQRTGSFSVPQTQPPAQPTGSVPAPQTEPPIQRTSSVSAPQPLPSFDNAQMYPSIVPLRKDQERFTIEIPVSQKYLGLCAETGEREFTHTRYTAVTCSPDEFGEMGSMNFTLRPASLGRATELFIVITMYNEDDRLFTKTMSSVIKNIAYLCSKACPRSWGPNGWTNIVVAIVADGRSKIDPRVLSVLSVMGVYPLEQKLPTKIGDRPVTSHLFEFTTQICIDEQCFVSTHKNGIVPVQVLFCLKEKNAKKINSHRWFFNAFGPHLQPNVCVLLDVGTKATRTSFFHLWLAFDRDPNVGGACGEIFAELGSQWSNLLNPLVAAQNFEYKMSNILDKPLESVFGYIQVLPGAFSAYRYRALQNGTSGHGPLAAYFLGEVVHTGAANLFSANLYLAEDRILCFELVAKKGESWVLRYVKNAKAETDVPSALPELVSQRRRWINGSFFAAVHAISHFSYFFRSSHSPIQKLLFAIQLIYNVINIVFNWFSLGNFYLIFYLLFNGITTNDLDPFRGNGPYVFRVLSHLYQVAIIAQFIIAFGNRPQSTKNLYYAVMISFAIIMCFMLFLGAYNVAIVVPKTAEEWSQIKSLMNQPTFRDVVVSLMSTYGLYIVSSILFLDPWHMFTSFFQYLVILPTYVNVFNVYAFCNLHDVSWGTKGDNVAAPVVVPQTLERGLSSKRPSQANRDGHDIKTHQDEETIILLDPEILELAYGAAQNIIKTKPVREPVQQDARTKVDDYFKSHRTRVILAWIFSNLLLIIIFSNDTINRGISSQELIARGIAPYLAFVFWTVAGLSAIRFLGSIVFLVSHYVDAWVIDVATRSKPFVPFNARV